MDLAVRLGNMARRKSEDRAETAMGATKAWRLAANAEIKRRGHGAHARCARAVGCKPPTLTLILNGTTAVSALVPKISDHLGIPRPGEVRRPEAVTRTIEKFATLSEDDQAIVSDLVNRLWVPPSNDQ